MKTIWAFRERLSEAGAIEARFDFEIREAGYIPMSGQIVDASLISTPGQGNSSGERLRGKAGESAAGIWPDKPAEAREKDTDARWSVQFGKARPASNGKHPPDIAIPTYGYKAHTSIDKRYRFIPKGDTRHGRQPPRCAHAAARALRQDETPATPFGPIAPIGQSRMRRSSRKTASPATSTAAKPRIKQCQPISGAATPPNPDNAPTSNTSSRIKSSR